MRILLFILPCAALGILLGVMAAGVKKGTNIFKTQAVAWIVTLVMIAGAIGIGYEKAHASNVAEPAPRPEPMFTSEPNLPNVPVDAAYVWDNAGVLSEQTKRELSQRNARLWNSYQVSIGVVTCNYGGDLGGYALQCAEDMGLGGYDMIVMLDISGDNYWLLQGNDIRRDFTDNDCSNYAYDYMEDFFVVGDYDAAVLDLTEALEIWYGTYY